MPPIRPSIHLPGSAKFSSNKNALHEYCQKKSLTNPKYRTRKEGNKYIASVEVNGLLFSSFSPQKSAKEAQQAVAFEVLMKLGYMGEASHYQVRATDSNSAVLDRENIVKLCAMDSFSLDGAHDSKVSITENNNKVSNTECCPVIDITDSNVFTSQGFDELSPTIASSVKNTDDNILSSREKVECFSESPNATGACDVTELPSFGTTSDSTAPIRDSIDKLDYTKLRVSIVSIENNFNKLYKEEPTPSCTSSDGTTSVIGNTDKQGNTELDDAKFSSLQTTSDSTVSIKDDTEKLSERASYPLSRVTGSTASVTEDVDEILFTEEYSLNCTSDSNVSIKHNSDKLSNTESSSSNCVSESTTTESLSKIVTSSSTPIVTENLTKPSFSSFSVNGTSHSTVTTMKSVGKRISTWSSSMNQPSHGTTPIKESRSSRGKKNISNAFKGKHKFSFLMVNVLSKSQQRRLLVS